MLVLNILGSRLKELRENKGLRQEDIADMFGYGKSTISQWESGKNDPEFKIITKLADYFNTTTDYLLGRTDNVSNDTGEKVVEILPGGVKKIPVYNLISKNRGEIFAQDNRIGEVPISATIMADYAILMNDDSMFPGIKTGSYVIIQEQPIFNNGQAVLAKLPDGSYTIRRATQTNSGIILTP